MVLCEYSVHAQANWFVASKVTSLLSQECRWDNKCLLSLLKITCRRISADCWLYFNFNFRIWSCIHYLRLNFACNKYNSNYSKKYVTSRSIWCLFYVMTEFNGTLKCAYTLYFISFGKNIYSRGFQTILPKESNYMGTKNSSIRNVYKNFGPRNQIWFRNQRSGPPWFTVQRIIISKTVSWETRQSTIKFILNS